MYLFKDGAYYDRVRECWLKLSGDYRFAQGVPYVFTKTKNGRYGYKKANILDLIRSWFIHD